MLFPHESYGKETYPTTRDSAQCSTSAKDWEFVTPKFVQYVGPDAEAKQKQPLFAVMWTKGGKYVLTGSSSGDII
jgi:hypothetical protein